MHTPDPTSVEDVEQHDAAVVERGQKVVITKLFRTNDIDWNFGRNGEHLPALTKSGFEVWDLPDIVMKKILDDHSRCKGELTPEITTSRDITGPRGEREWYSSYSRCSIDLKRWLVKYFREPAEDWAKCSLEPFFVHGFRRYHRGAILELHRDKICTHHIGIVIHVANSLSHPWAFVIEDHNYRRHQVYLKAGQALIFESAKLLHGRPESMEGEGHDNIYLHFKNPSFIFEQ